MTMQPYQERVVTERAELYEKMQKLTAFFNTTTYASLDQNEQARLQRQIYAMRSYLEVLDDRIAAFK